MHSLGIMQFSGIQEVSSPGFHLQHCTKEIQINKYLHLKRQELGVGNGEWCLKGLDSVAWEGRVLEVHYTNVSEQ